MLGTHDRHHLVVIACLAALVTTCLPASQSVAAGPVPAASSEAAVVTPTIEELALGDVLQDEPVPEGVESDDATVRAAQAGSVVVTDQVETGFFTAAGVTWDAADGGADVRIELRLRESGVWSEWVAIDVETGIPDASTPEGEAASGTIGTEPLLTDGADAVQARVSASHAVDVSAMTLSLVDGGRAVADDTASMGVQAAASGSAPAIVTRAQWGADESLRSGSTINSTVKAVFVHHTASTNSYSSTNAPAQIRSIYAYHTQKLGWADIGYNFLVDKFGTAYEGRAGSITKAVRGAHTGGFNVDTMGVSALGNYEVAAAPSAMVNTIGRVTGWKLGQYGQDVSSSVTLTSAGGGTSRYAAGKRVTVEAVSGHKAVCFTACPGVYLYNKLATIRSTAEVTTAVTRPVQLAGQGATPLTADVDGDGAADVGWFRDGAWAFLTSQGPVVEFTYGRKGDIPVVGDFANSGRDGIGVVRSGVWHLRWTASGGPAQSSFSYGWASDTPIVGRWPGTARESVGVKRANRWHLRDAPSAGPARWSFSFGLASDRPTTGDWTGNGFDRPGLLRDGRWHLAASTSDLRTRWSFAFGRGDDRPVAGDWDGNGSDGAGVVRGTTFLGRNGLSGGDAQFSRDFAT